MGQMYVNHVYADQILSLCGTWTKNIKGNREYCKNGSKFFMYI